MTERENEILFSGKLCDKNKGRVYGIIINSLESSFSTLESLGLEIRSFRNRNLKLKQLQWKEKKQRSCEGRASEIGCEDWGMRTIEWEERKTRSKRWAAIAKEIKWLPIVELNWTDLTEFLKNINQTDQPNNQTDKNSFFFLCVKTELCSTLLVNALKIQKVSLISSFCWVLNLRLLPVMSESVCQSQHQRWTQHSQLLQPADAQFSVEI